MGIFSNVNQHRGSGGGIWFLCLEGGGEAQYRVRIDRVIATRTRLGEGNFIIETEILKSNHPLRPVGSHPSQAIVLNKDAAPGNVADFCRVGLACLSDLVIAEGSDAVGPFCAELVKWKMPDLSTVVATCAKEGRPVEPGLVNLSDEAVEDWIGGEENCLSGIELDVRAWNKPTRAGKNFTRVMYSVPPDVQTAATRQ